MSTPVVDLHCDLPIFLALAEHFGETRTIYDRRSRCSVPQLREGVVVFQTLALFAPPIPDHALFGLHQAEQLARTLEKHGDVLRWVREVSDLDAHLGADPEDERIGVMAAVEGASTFAAEDEPLDDALARFDQIRQIAGPLLYVSLTWVNENRFGGGNDSKKGLEPDGRVLLEYLAEQGVAVDLSHASPRLAHDILDFSYARDLELRVLASHSPYAGIKDLPRNLTDDAAKEIAARGGVVGLNVMRRYVEGEAPQAFVEQLRYARDELGILGSQVLGADFFCTDDVPEEMKDEDDPEFFDDFGDSSCYPRLLDAVQEGLDLSDDQRDALAHATAYAFIRRALA